MSLEDDVNEIVRKAAQATSIGMAAWVHAAEGVKEQATPREDETQVEALARVFEASRELMLALVGANHEALLLVAREVDALRDAGA